MIWAVKEIGSGGDAAVDRIVMKGFCGEVVFKGIPKEY